MLLALLSEQRRQTMLSLSVSQFKLIPDKWVFVIKTPLMTFTADRHVSNLEFAAYQTDPWLCFFLQE